MEVFIGAAIAGTSRSRGAGVAGIDGRDRLAESIAASDRGEYAESVGGETGAIGEFGDETRGA